MKIAIDSYSYHRYFGEVYAGIETDPGWRMNQDEFLQRAESIEHMRTLLAAPLPRA